MKYWIILDKNTGEFMPAHKGLAGFTWDNPTFKGIPRLFSKAHHAQNALDKWKKGGWTRNYPPKTLTSLFETDCDFTLKIQKFFPERALREMEIVEVSLRIKSKRGAEISEWQPIESLFQRSQNDHHFR